MRRLLAAAGAAVVLTLTATTAAAVDVDGEDPSGDAPALADITAVRYSITDETVVAQLDVRDLKSTGKFRVFFGNQTNREYLIDLQRQNGTVSLKLFGRVYAPSASSWKPVSCATTFTNWVQSEDRLNVGVDRTCFRVKDTPRDFVMRSTGFAGDKIDKTKLEVVAWEGIVQ